MQLPQCVDYFRMNIHFILQVGLFRHNLMHSSSIATNAQNPKIIRHHFKIITGTLLSRMMVGEISTNLKLIFFKLLKFYAIKLHEFDVSFNIM